MSEQLTGVVKWFDLTKGFGFISQDNGEQDVFLHHSVLQPQDKQNLDTGHRVSFEIEQSDKGIKALNVERI